MPVKYDFGFNKTGKEVEWYVDLSTVMVMAMTSDEAEEKALEQIKNMGVDICEITMVEGQEITEEG